MSFWDCHSVIGGHLQPRKEAHDKFLLARHNFPLVYEAAP